MKAWIFFVFVLAAGCAAPSPPATSPAPGPPGPPVASPAPAPASSTTLAPPCCKRACSKPVDCASGNCVDGECVAPQPD